MPLLSKTMKYRTCYILCQDDFAFKILATVLHDLKFVDYVFLKGFVQLAHDKNMGEIRLTGRA